MNYKMNKGFTLIELLLVIAIIALLASVILVSLEGGRKAARDTQRLSDMRDILYGLEMYYGSQGYYPAITDNDCEGWDAGYMTGDDFLKPLVDSGIVSRVPIDPVSKPEVDPCTWGYHYRLYDAGAHDCDITRGKFFVLGVKDMEGSNRPHSQSPGFTCGTKNWQNDFDWVIGRFER